MALREGEGSAAGSRSIERVARGDPEAESGEPEAESGEPEADKAREAVILSGRCRSLLLN